MVQGSGISLDDVIFGKKGANCLQYFVATGARHGQLCTIIQEDVISSDETNQMPVDEMRLMHPYECRLGQ